ncbi:hypothetical protein [Amycolatopsis sp.]|jgi:hypothetical protein|uniref:hypothetical protein n=1 Tax=Amycolatopsis sp. TaxID=37632 RepID=UPI00262BF7FA|nr:hypothetical protein [Amycolatopsis sp.]
MRRPISSRWGDAQLRRDRAEQTIHGANWSEGSESGTETALAAWLVRAHTIAVADAELTWWEQAEAIIAEHFDGKAD